MRLVHGFIGFIFWVIILAVGTVLITSFWGAHTVVMNYLITQPTERFLIGAFLLLMVILYAVSAISRGAKGNYFSYSNEEGVVNISVKAINQLLSRLANEFAGIVSLRADVQPREKSISLDVAVQEGIKIQELSQALQLRVRQILSETLGISAIGSIKVIITEITMPRKASAAEKAEQREWENISI